MRRRQILKSFFSLLLKAGMMAGTLWILFEYVLGVHILHANNMAPAMRDGDLVITARCSQIYADAVVAYCAEGTVRFGRVVALPGDIVYMDKDGKYLINGSVSMELIYYDTKPAENRISYPYTVPENSYFIMNDMREDANDSRSWGAISREAIEGVEYLSLRRRSF